MLNFSRLNLWQQFLFLFALDSLWNFALAALKSERRAIRALKWMDRKLAGRAAHASVMASACLLYGLFSVYGMFGSVRFIYKLRKSMRRKNDGLGRKAGNSRRGNGSGTFPRNSAS